MKTPKKKLVESRSVTKGQLYITATFNNTLINVTDINGNTLCWGTTGSAGFKGSRKSTPFAATTAVEKVIEKAKGLGLKEVEVYIKGPGPGRDAALRVLKRANIKVSLIADVTPIPHNGPRARKRRRV